MAPNVEILLKMRDEASNQVKGFNNQLKNMSSQLKVAGAALSAFGAAGMATIKSFSDASLEQQKAVNTLATLVENTGASWTNYEDKVMEVTSALQDKTNYGDEQQIRVLGTLTTQLGSVEKAMAALPAVLDAASASGLGVESVARTMGKALAGNANQAESVGIYFDKAAGFGERLQQVLDAVGGSAEANADPFTQLGNILGDIKEVIGAAIMPALKQLAEPIKAVANWFKNLDPAIIKVIGLALLAATAFAAIVGPILLLLGFLPMLIAGFAAIPAVLAFIMTWILPVIAAIMVVAGLAYIIISNWTEITNFFRTLWEGIVTLFKEHWDKILMAVAPFLAIPILIIKHWDAIVAFFKELPEKIKTFFANLVDYIKSPFIEAINWIVDKINWLIEQFNKISPFEVGMIGRIGEPKIPTADTGGVFRGPGAVRIGNISEMMIPMGRSVGVASATYNITVNTDVLEGDEQSARRWARTLLDYIREDQRRTTGAA